MNIKEIKESIPIAEYVKGKGQVDLASRLGITQGGLSKALRANRNILISEGSEGLKAFEVREFPSAR